MFPATEAAFTLVQDGAPFGRVLLDAYDTGILVCNATADAILDANVQICQMFGHTRPDFLALNPDRLLAINTLRQAARHQGAMPRRAERRCVARDGREFFCELSLRDIATPAGPVTVVTASDITERKRLIEALRRSQERLSVATKSARIGIWDWDIVNDILVWDAGMYDLYGMREQDFAGAYDAWQDALHPDDRGPGDLAIKAAIQGIKDFNIEFRIVRPDGEVRDIEAHALVQGEPGGQARRMIGINWDITERKRATDTIRLQAGQYATMIATTPDAYFTFNRQGEIGTVNEAFCRMTGYAPGEAASLNFGQINAAETASELNRHLAIIAGAGCERFQSRLRRKTGDVIDIEISVSFWDGEPGQYLCFARDITQRLHAEKALLDSEARWKAVLEANVDGIAKIDADTLAFCFTNQAFCDLLGYSPADMQTIGVADIYAPDTLQAVLSFFRQLLGGATRVAPDLPMRRKDGTIVFADLSASPADVQGRTSIVCCFHDVTLRKQAEAQIARMASHDLLTELANRRTFVILLDQTIARARRNGSSFAVLYLDLDHFKDVNDTLGHPAGDELLKAVAHRLRTCVRGGDTVARFGGDEFAIILDDIGDAGSAAIAARRLLTALQDLGGARGGAAVIAANVADTIVKLLAEPVTIDANRVYSGASVGLVVYGPDAPDAETILSNADLALYRAKSDRRGTYRFFTPEMDAAFRSRVIMSAELRDAIAGHQFCLDYQPQVDIESRRIVGLEALVRWNHPVSGKLGPGKFIGEAERNGLIVPLGRWVIEEACRQAKAWSDAGLAPKLIAVNLSGVQFKMPLELEKDIANIVARSGISPGLLELELTESVLMEASRDHNDVLLRLRRNGYRIAIDDFGSGYSSLDYLRRYPVDRIKIAQTFIADIGVQPGNDAIVRAALGLARELGIEVVVEGVETAPQVALLKAWGGRIVQGYYFARPQPPQDVAGLLRAGRISPGHGGEMVLANA